MVRFRRNIVQISRMTQYLDNGTTRVLDEAYTIHLLVQDQIIPDQGSIDSLVGTLLPQRRKAEIIKRFWSRKSLRSRSPTLKDKNDNSMVASMDFIFEGADIWNAYLYGDLDTLLMKELPTDSSGKPQKKYHAAKVINSLDGHLSAGNIWRKVIYNSFTSCGLMQSTEDKLFYFQIQVNSFLVLTIVVDDTSMTSNCRSLIEALKVHLSA